MDQLTLHCSATHLTTGPPNITTLSSRIVIGITGIRTGDTAKGADRGVTPLQD